jgi:hypothetical protein
MEPLRSTDYFAAIPYVPVVGFIDLGKKPGTIRRFSGTTVADLALAALVVTAAIMVVLVILNWSR